MDIYHYFAGSGEFFTQGLADPSPLEPGVWLVPAYATTVAPPAAPEGKRPVWRDDAWQLVEDHRGLTVWLADGTETVIDQLGPLPEGASTEPPAGES